ncbi:MAG: hypothetical protein JJU29_21165 [Verrucomicrobia bacterium]|nr:hypothetical protein [Verrucomicrobiota bacterium]MCH8514530.1 hypothetical protein [Kiritimatiellia bacterium]
MKLDPDSLRWQFDVYRWLFENFGGYKAFLHQELVLPTGGFFAESSPPAIFETVKQYAGMEDWPCSLGSYGESSPLDQTLRNMPFGGKPNPGTAGHITEENREIVIRYNSDLEDDPVSLIATFAHELAHYLIFNAFSKPPFGREHEEYATDLTAVFLGFGVFLANSTFKFSQWQDFKMQGWSYRRQGYLGELDLSYGLAIFCLLKECDPKTVLPHLRPNPRSYLKTALRHLRKRHKGDIEALTRVEALFSMRSKIEL